MGAPLSIFFDEERKKTGVRGERSQYLLPGRSLSLFCRRGKRGATLVSRGYQRGKKGRSMRLDKGFTLLPSPRKKSLCCRRGKKERHHAREELGDQGELVRREGGKTSELAWTGW